MVIQTNFYTSPSTQAKLDSGEWVRDGQFCKDAKTGKFTECLPEIKEPSKTETERMPQAKSGYNANNNFGINTNVNKNNGWLYAVGAVGAVGAVILAIGIRHSRKYCQEVEDYTIAYNAYKTKIKNADLDLETIKQLLTAIDKVKSSKRYDRIKKFLPGLSCDDLKDLLEYTKRFVEANDMTFEKPDNKFEIHLLQALLLAERAVFYKEMEKERAA